MPSETDQFENGILYIKEQQRAVIAAMEKIAVIERQLLFIKYDLSSLLLPGQPKKARKQISMIVNGKERTL